MGNSGVRKIFFQGDIVETRYSNVYDIKNVINLEREEEDLNNYKGKVRLI